MKDIIVFTQNTMASIVATREVLINNSDRIKAIVLASQFKGESFTDQLKVAYKLTKKSSFSFFFYKLLESKKIVPTTLKFVDIAGLVQGASKGEGLGNKFLGNIREVDSIAHVLRCFKGDVTHVLESIDPIRDLEIINLELAISDLQIIEKRILKIQQQKLELIKKYISD